MRIARRLIDGFVGIYHLTRAQNRMSKHDYVGAISFLESGKFSEYQQTEVLILLGNCSYRLKKFRDAINFYKRAIANEENGKVKRRMEDSAFLVAYAHLYSSAAKKNLGDNISQEEIEIMKVRIRGKKVSLPVRLGFRV